MTFPHGLLMVLFPRVQAQREQDDPSGRLMPHIKPNQVSVAPAVTETPRQASALTSDLLPGSLGDLLRPRQHPRLLPEQRAASPQQQQRARTQTAGRPGPDQPGPGDARLRKCSAAASR